MGTKTEPNKQQATFWLHTFPKQHQPRPRARSQHESIMSSASPLSSTCTSHRTHPSSSSSSSPPHYSSPSSSSSSWLKHGGPRTRDERAYLTELSQRRRHTVATVADLSIVREHEVVIQRELLASEQRVTRLSHKLEKSQALLRDSEKDKDKDNRKRHRRTTNNNYYNNDSDENKYNDDEQRRLKSCVRLLEMDVDDAKMKVIHELRALAEVTRTARDIQNDLHRQWKLIRSRRDKRKQTGKEEEKKVDSKGRPVLPCAVCLEEIVRERGDAMALPCGHVFHDECVSAWLRRKQTCPTCQMTVVWQS